MPRRRYVPQHPDTPDYAKQIKLATAFDQLRTIAEAVDADNTLSNDERRELLAAGRQRWLVLTQRQKAAAEQ